jgi:uracil-DNA glycosylase
MSTHTHHDLSPEEARLKPGSASKVQLEESWKIRLQDEFNKPYMKDLKAFLQSEKKKGKIIYPPSSKIFEAMNRTPFEKVKVVILGQDPYHGPKQAHGLCFSVLPGTPFPPSLQNIFKELHSDLGVPIPKSGDLSKWADEGVLLLNTTLTVEQGKPLSHQKKGWEQFTDKVIHLLNEERKNLVFILWGGHAQKKAEFLNKKKHLVLTSVHPSPLSVHRGFYTSQPFSKANAYLKSHGETPIDWNPVD